MTSKFSLHKPLQLRVPIPVIVIDIVSTRNWDHGIQNTRSKTNEIDISIFNGVDDVCVGHSIHGMRGVEKGGESLMSQLVVGGYAIRGEK